MKYELREHQVIDIEKIRAEYKAGARSVLYVSPTGSGKTIVFGFITENAYKKGKSILILTHRNSILEETKNKLNEIGLRHGIIASGYSSIRYRIQLASVQTLVRRLHQWPYDTFNLIVIDEAHHIGAKTWQKIREHFYTAKIYGTTATPIRMDNYGLGNDFETMVVGASYKYLASMGYLSKPKYYIPEHIDLSEVRKTAGDYNKKDLNFTMDKKYITGNAIEYYAKYSDKEPALAFCVSINHAIHVMEEFKKAGYLWDVMHSKMDRRKIIEVINNLRTGKIHGASSCDLVGEGTDIPKLKTVIQLRPTLSLTINHQQNGRGSRPYPGKENSIHIDHVGNCEKFGLIDWPIKWELTKGKFIPKIASLKTCEYCFVPYPSTMRKCPECGQVQISTRQRKEPEKREGELKEINYKELNKEIEESDTLEEYIKLAKKMNYQEYWAYYMYEIHMNRKVTA